MLLAQSHNESGDGRLLTVMFYQQHKDKETKVLSNSLKKCINPNTNIRSNLSEYFSKCSNPFLFSG